MKMPKVLKRYCPKCKKHTEHKAFISKKKAASALTYGSKYRARKRGRARGFGNKGRYSKPAVTKFKMTGKKQTKKVDLRYQCNVCKKTQTTHGGLRLKKLDFE
jgi:large subunit ribosomal protein L44e